MDDQYPCLPGSYGDTTNLTSADECKTCPLGYVCGWATTSLAGENQRPIKGKISLNILNRIHPSCSGVETDGFTIS